MVTDYYRNVFISKNNGETWIKFNSGIPDNSTRYSYGSGSAYFVDSHYVYLSFPGLGLFRRSINDFNGNILSGKVYNDKNNNGIQDANEIPISNIVVSSKASRNYTLSDSMGNYLLGAEITQNDTVRPFLNTPHATIKPAFYIIQTTDTGKNFGIYYTPNINDIRLTATHIQPARPGFLHKIVLTCENIGSTILNTKVNLDYDNLIEYQTSVPTPDAILSQSLTWNLLNFQPFEKRNITIQFKTPTTVNLNSILTYAAKIEPILGDIFPNDNIDTLRQFVVGSFDPNDKIANKSYIDYKQLDIPTPIVYTIRFQNTGNYPATFVRIIDTLSPFADISTLQILSYSHPMTYSLKGKGILDCLFNNINLPNSSNNELASHGFVKYSIKPLTTMQLGDVLRNSAQIYFDYNQPILTNTTENKAIILTLTEDIVNINLLKTIPNPTQGDIYFQMPESVNFLGSSFKLQVFNSLGETVLQKSMINYTPNYINLSNLPDGLYLLKVQIGNTVFVAKTTLLKK